MQTGFFGSTPTVIGQRRPNGFCGVNDFIWLSARVIVIFDSELKPDNYEASRPAAKTFRF
jgi:hypothetical protein